MMFLWKRPGSDEPEPIPAPRDTPDEALRRKQAIAAEVEQIRKRYDLGEFACPDDPFVRAVLQIRGFYRQELP